MRTNKNLYLFIALLNKRFNPNLEVYKKNSYWQFSVVLFCIANKLFQVFFTIQAKTSMSNLITFRKMRLMLNVSILWGFFS